MPKRPNLHPGRVKSGQVHRARSLLPLVDRRKEPGGEDRVAKPRSEPRNGRCPGAYFRHGGAAQLKLHSDALGLPAQNRSKVALDDSIDVVRAQFEGQVMIVAEIANLTQQVARLTAAETPLPRGIMDIE